MADLHRLPLRGHDLPFPEMGGFADTAHPDFSRTRAKARVFRTETLIGYGWRWEHSCRWKFGVLSTSYPLESWGSAYYGALRHLEDCL